VDAILVPIEQGLFWVLQLFFSWVGDYGIAIILLTVVMRLVLFPLTWKQTKSMYELQRLQPKIKALQEKYKNDKEKLQEETLKFYQEHKVNPLGGCLPLLLQMPVFIALFRVLGSSGTKKVAGKAVAQPGLLLSHIAGLSLAAQETAKQFWIILPDITKTPAAMAKLGVGAAIPYAALVVLFGLSVWLPQRLQPNQDPQQQNIGLVMAVMMLFFGWSAPAGVLLYWVTSSLLGIAQQVVTQKVLAAEHGDEVASANKKPVKSSKKGANK